MKTVEVSFRIGRGDGYWEAYRVERVLKIVLPYGQEKLGDEELAEIGLYATMLANREQAIIRVEFEGEPPVTQIISPSKWKKEKSRRGGKSKVVKETENGTING